MSKLILITGAAKRIGRHLALSLAEAGYDIAIHYGKSGEAAAKLQQDIKSLGQKASCFQADLTKADQSHGLFHQVAQEMGQPFALINNASIFEEDSIQTANSESWHRHMEANLHAPMILSQAMFLSRGASEKGHIINIIDQRVLNLTPHFLSYTLSKSGLWTLTQSLAMAMAPSLQVNAIAPGPTLPSSRQAQEDFETQCKSLPLQRATPLSDISAAALFLLKNQSMTGQILTLDGGEHLGWAQPANGFTPTE